MTRIAYFLLALAAATPLAAQTQLPPAQDLDMLEAMVVGSLQALLIKRFPKLSAPTSDEVYALAEHLTEPATGPKHSHGNRGSL